MKKILAITLLGIGLLQMTSHAQTAEREFAFNNYRRYYSEARQGGDQEKLSALSELRSWFREHPQNMAIDKELEKSARHHLDKLLENGTFTSMNAKERYFKKNHIFSAGYHNTQEDEVGIFIGSAFKRIFQITSAFRLGLIEGEIPDKVLKAILHYGGMELDRSNDLPRFHASCFAIPTGAVNVYFSLLEDMDQAERGQASPLMTEACDMLKAVALEAWTQPLRRDETDQNVVSLERFRKHVWWVGGNALAYRQLLPVAAMYTSVPMVDLLAEICQKCISVTSQTTYDESFWTEGFTADGAGWGHGRQCLIWGYPIHGTSSALKMLSLLKGTPWAKSLSKENTAALMNFFRGGAWYWYKGYRLIGLDRNSYVYNPSEQDIPYKDMLDNVISDWLTSFTEEEQKELLRLQQEATTKRIDMSSTKPGQYYGIRWFFNNDDFIRKTPDCHVSINMASIRCDGLECIELEDPYNFYCNDGATLLLREGNEYFQIMGGWDVTAYPGTTSREGMDQLEKVTNWRGYCSKHNFAVATTDHEKYGAAGFLFEKMDARDKGKKSENIQTNQVLYGFKAYKSWFFLDNLMIALGAGITDQTPESSGMIRTTLDQTALVEDVYLQMGRKKRKLGPGMTSLSAAAGLKSLASGSRPVWITQKGKFSYCLLPEYSEDGYVSLETQMTDWVKMNRRNKTLEESLPETSEILRIWTEHGLKPVDETYGYAVYLGKDTPPSRLPFKIVRNDTLVQAISANKEKLVQAVFYPGKEGKGFFLDTGKTRISVSAPCALILDKEKRLIHLTDACMNPSLKEIKVEINEKEYHIPMPQGELCGSSTTIPL